MRKHRKLSREACAEVAREAARLREAGKTLPGLEVVDDVETVLRAALMHV